MSARVSLFEPIELGDFNYLFFLVGLTDYDTEVRKEVLENIEAFGEDLGLVGNVVVPYKTRRHETATEVIEKNWPDDFRKRLVYEGDPFMLIIQGNFATFDPQSDPWSVIWFSDFKKRATDITRMFHRLAVMAKRNEDIFLFLKKIAKQDRYKKWAKYFEIKTGIFGCTIDAKAIFEYLAGV